MGLIEKLLMALFDSALERKKKRLERDREKDPEYQQLKKQAEASAQDLKEHLAKTSRPYDGGELRRRTLGDLDREESLTREEKDAQASSGQSHSQ